jgi:hypothetical protein
MAGRSLVNKLVAHRRRNVLFHEIHNDVDLRPARSSSGNVLSDLAPHLSLTNRAAKDDCFVVSDTELGSHVSNVATSVSAECLEVTSLITTGGNRAGSHHDVWCDALPRQCLAEMLEAMVLIPIAELGQRVPHKCPQLLAIGSGRLYGRQPDHLLDLDFTPSVQPVRRHLVEHSGSLRLDV